MRREFIFGHTFSFLSLCVLAPLRRNRCHNRPLAVRLVTALVLSLATAPVFADAIVVTKAMTASTIAEVSIDRDAVRVTLEIGEKDRRAFGNLLFVVMRDDDVSEEQRRERFLQGDWAIRIDGNESLVGNVEYIETRRRVLRDEVTGEPLAEQPADAEWVVSVRIVYRFDGEPKTLSIRPPMVGKTRNAAANIGFIVYHMGLPVTDFRYLGGEETVDLDWEDPWYSRFRNRNLKRQFDAPLSVFLYVEHFEVRKEIIVRPKDLAGWLDLGLDRKSVIRVEDQAALKRRVAEFFLKRSPVIIDGEAIKPQLDRIHFIRRTLRRTGVVDPPEDLDATSATLGVIFVYPIDGLPDEVAMTWDMFTPRIERVPAVATDEAGGLPQTLTPDDAVLVWKNFLTHPVVPAFTTIAAPPERPQLVFSLISLGCGTALIVLLVISLRAMRAAGKPSKALVITGVVVAACAVICWPYTQVAVANPFVEPPRLADDDARAVIGGLLHNVYRAFDRHDESLIYDRLARSVAGPLLGEVFLTTRKTTEVKNQGGVRITVKQVEILDLSAEPPDGMSEYTFRCRWRVAGSIGHWGHIHRRVGEHRARLTIAPIDGTWKITAIEMMDAQPLDTTGTN